MFRKISGSFNNNTLAVLEKLKTALPTSLPLNKLEIKTRMSSQLSRLSRNIYSLSTSLSILSIMSSLLSTAKAEDPQPLNLFFKSLNSENHYKLAASGEVLYGMHHKYFDCNTMIDGNWPDSFYQAIAGPWQGKDAAGFEYFAQFFRGLNEEVNSTIENCVKRLIENEVKIIEDEVDQGKNLGKVILVCLALAAILLAMGGYQYVKERYQQRSAQAESESSEENDLEVAPDYHQFAYR